MILLTLAVGAVVAYLVIYMYRTYTMGRCESDADMTGKTVIITGGNCGIGYETALDLAGRGARVILACRNTARSENAVNLITKATGNHNVVARNLDLSSFASIRRFAEKFNRTEARLDVLINNAGVIAGSEKKLTEDGLEFAIGVNHFGHFLLTNLLLDKLKRSAPSRVVVVSSRAQAWGKIDFDNLNSEKSYNANVYFHTKLANVLFAKELHRQFHDLGISVFSLHPGTVKSELLKNLQQPLKFIFDYLLIPLFFRSAKEGAQTSIYCAVQPDIEYLSGKYFMGCKVADEGPNARDDATARKLWEISETITGLA